MERFVNTSVEVASGTLVENVSVYVWLREVNVFVTVDQSKSVVVISPDVRVSVGVGAVDKSDTYVIASVDAFQPLPLLD